MLLIGFLQTANVQLTTWYIESMAALPPLGVSGSLKMQFAALPLRMDAPAPCA